MSSAATVPTTYKCVSGEGLDTVEVEPWRVKEIPGLTIVGTTIANTGNTSLEAFYDQRGLETRRVDQFTHMFSTASCDTVEEGEIDRGVRRVNKTDLASHIKVFREIFIPEIRTLIMQGGSTIDASTDAALTELTNTAAEEIPYHFMGHQCTSAVNATGTKVGIQKQGVVTGAFKATKDENGEWIRSLGFVAPPVGGESFDNIASMTFH